MVLMVISRYNTPNPNCSEFITNVEDYCKSIVLKLIAILNRIIKLIKFVKILCLR